MSDRLEFFRDSQAKFRWRYVAANGNVLADSGQGYTRREDALHGAAVVVNGEDYDQPLIASAVTELEHALEIVDLDEAPVLSEEDEDALARRLMTAFVGSKARASSFRDVPVSGAWKRVAQAAHAYFGRG